jgi:hypothetical protein
MLPGFRLLVASFLCGFAVVFAGLRLVASLHNAHGALPIMAAHAATAMPAGAAQARWTPAPVPVVYDLRFVASAAPQVASPTDRTVPVAATERSAPALAPAPDAVPAAKPEAAAEPAPATPAAGAAAPAVAAAAVEQRDNLPPAKLGALAVAAVDSQAMADTATTPSPPPPVPAASAAAPEVEIIPPPAPPTLAAPVFASEPRTAAVAPETLTAEPAVPASAVAQPPAAQPAVAKPSARKPPVAKPEPKQATLGAEPQKATPAPKRAVPVVSRRRRRLIRGARPPVVLAKPVPKKHGRAPRRIVRRAADPYAATGFGTNFSARQN